jgi:hypothetical protein
MVARSSKAFQHWCRACTGKGRQAQAELEVIRVLRSLSSEWPAPIHSPSGSWIVADVGAGQQVLAGGIVAHVGVACQIIARWTSIVVGRSRM